MVLPKIVTSEMIPAASPNRMVNPSEYGRAGLLWRGTVEFEVLNQSWGWGLLEMRVRSISDELALYRCWRLSINIENYRSIHPVSSDSPLMECICEFVEHSQIHASTTHSFIYSFIRACMLACIHAFIHSLLELSRALYIWSIWDHPAWPQCCDFTRLFIHSYLPSFISLTVNSSLNCL